MPNTKYEILNTSPGASSGFTLIEVLLAFFVVLIGIGGAFGLMTFLVSVSATDTNRLIAVYLAQEGAEITRNIRDGNFISGSDWDDGISPTDCLSGCQGDYNDASLVAYGNTFLNLDANNMYSYDAGTPRIFKRKITTVDGAGGNKITVTVEVFWEDRGKQRTEAVIAELYNY
ncbi:MAG: prepilin-type N-terminal cleavage/methylation domain-containing protein [Candidatus Wildermuthbacteria bacterium]|nr:prepilin-type N-terminal cleavage/methylation domain-containing protein [Candidatus Wildermuthbacteria bacterium]